MKIFRVLRQNTLLNYILRTAFKKSSRLSTSIHEFLIKRWSPSGVMDCNFGSYEFKYYSKCDDGLPHYFYYDFPYNETADLNLFIELSKKSTTIIDIGANTGLFSVLASKANPKAQIHAIEPYHVNAARMNLNLNLNGITNVMVHEMALGENNGKIDIAVPANQTVTDVSSVNSSFSKSLSGDLEWSSQTVDIRTLDSLIEEHKWNINLIKCDVETFEMSVFKGADQVLKKNRPTIIFECFLDEERKEFFNQVLAQYDYYVYIILEQGLVYVREGFIDFSYGLNYLITPVKPIHTFVSYKNKEALWKGVLLHPSE